MCHVVNKSELCYKSEFKSKLVFSQVLRTYLFAVYLTTLSVAQNIHCRMMPYRNEEGYDQESQPYNIYKNFVVMQRPATAPSYWEILIKPALRML
jgi:hypothetical protein